MVAVGFSPRTAARHTVGRRGATRELSIAFRRRSATPFICSATSRGLKPTTLTASLREHRWLLRGSWSQCATKLARRLPLSQNAPSSRSAARGAPHRADLEIGAPVLVLAFYAVELITGGGYGLAE